MNINELKNKLNNEYTSVRGVYNKAVIGYALELVENIENHRDAITENLENINKYDLQKMALNGAQNWAQYSWGGCSLCYNYDILENLFCPSIVKKYENADHVRGVHLLDIQARAIGKGFTHLYHIIKNNK